MATIIRPTYLPRQEKEDNWLMKALVQGLTNYALDKSRSDDAYERQARLDKESDDRKIQHAEDMAEKKTEMFKRAERFIKKGKEGEIPNAEDLFLQQAQPLEIENINAKHDVIVTAQKYRKDEKAYDETRSGGFIWNKEYNTFLPFDDHIRLVNSINTKSR